MCEVASAIYLSKRKLRYHGDGNIVCSEFMTPSGCRDLVQLCEQHAGWRSDSTAVYAFTTVDLEVDKVPALKIWCQQVGLLDKISARVAQAHGGFPLTALDDLFVVKYTARGKISQQELPRHVDAGDLSFMVALSALGDDYDGGGTGFDVLGDSGSGQSEADQRAAIHLQQGELVSFDASLYHRGLPTTRGVRYLLVGFGFTRLDADKEPGNMTLELDTVPSRLPIRPKRALAKTWESTTFASSIMPGTSSNTGSIIDGLLKDALLVHAESPGRSYWLPRQRYFSCEELTALENYVLSVLFFHERHTLPTRQDSQSAGAEFWVQVGGITEGMPFHYDKDEVEATETETRFEDESATEAQCGHKRKQSGAAAADRPYRHPQLATVTYLSTGGAPTVVFNEGATEAFVSYPRSGKHLAFPGHLLHGVPPELNTRWRSKDLPNRVTLLVNVWQSRKPKDIIQLPRSMAAQLRPVCKAQPWQVSNQREVAESCSESASVKPSCAPCLVLEVPRSSADNAATLTALDEHVEGFTARLPTRELWHIEACPLSAEKIDEGSDSPVPSSCHIMHDT